MRQKKVWNTKSLEGQRVKFSPLTLSTVLLSVTIWGSIRRLVGQRKMREMRSWAAQWVFLFSRSAGNSFGMRWRARRRKEGIVGNARGETAQPDARNCSVTHARLNCHTALSNNFAFLVPPTSHSSFAGATQNRSALLLHSFPHKLTDKKITSGGVMVVSST